jgi:hypothetical protein
MSRVGNKVTGCQVCPKPFSFFLSFLTYFSTLTDTEAVPNGRKWHNSDEQDGERDYRLLGVCSFLFFVFIFIFH